MDGGGALPQRVVNAFFVKVIATRANRPAQQFASYALDVALSMAQIALHRTQGMPEIVKSFGDGKPNYHCLRLRGQNLVPTNNLLVLPK